MCGRISYSDQVDPRWVRERFGVSVAPEQLSSRFNIAPTDPVMAVARDDGQRRAEVLRWDLFGRRPPLINIRSETALERPAFHRLLESAGTRVLVLADGFYEWLHAEAPGQPKLPLRFHLRERAVFAFPGLRSREGCAIFTTTPNDLVAPVHDRMPVILDNRDEEEAWLDPTVDAGIAAELLDPLPAERMQVLRASSRVNDVRADGAALWEAEAPTAPASVPATLF
jgi:putative SOS response-associated peptidase YedK